MILLLALGLAMDAMAASAALGSRDRSLRLALTCAALFGGFQALMPLLGYGLGHVTGPWFQQWERYIACGILCLLGVKMLLESQQPGGTGTLLLLAFATSIDAFAAGFTLPLLKAPMWITVSVIGAVTALLSFVGARLGQRLPAKWADVVGGVVLIGLGVKALWI